MNATTTPETSQSLGLSDPEIEANNEQIILEGPRDSPLGSETGWDVSEVKINQYFESEDEDEQGYIRQGEKLEDIYGDDELSELEGDELERSLKLVMEDQMERIEKRKRDQGLTPYETVMQGAVKKYLREHCDYTFDTLKDNIPKALESVQLSTIWKWEHRMIQWMEVYRDRKSTKDAQFDVKKYGSRRYTSHRRVLESVARRFDEPLTN